jgi:hypothetical protein
MRRPPRTISRSTAGIVIAALAALALVFLIIYFVRAGSSNRSQSPTLVPRSTVAAGANGSPASSGHVASTLPPPSTSTPIATATTVEVAQASSVPAINGDTPTAAEVPQASFIPAAPTSTKVPTPTPTDTPVPTATHTPTVTSTPRPTPTFTPTATATRLPTATVVPTPTPIPLSWLHFKPCQGDQVIAFNTSDGLSGTQAIQMGWGHGEVAGQNPYTWTTDGGCKLTAKIRQQDKGFALVPIEGLNPHKDYIISVYAENGNCHDSWNLLSLLSIGNPTQAAVIGRTTDEPSKYVTALYRFTLPGRLINADGQVILVFQNLSEGCPGFDSAAIAGLSIKEK